MAEEKPLHGAAIPPSWNHELDEADLACPACGGALAEMAGQCEESEEVDVLERRFVLKKKHMRKKYRCACGGCVETALGPPKLWAGGRYSIDFAIAVAIQKYLDRELPQAFGAAVHRLGDARRPARRAQDGAPRGGPPPRGTPACHHRGWRTHDLLLWNVQAGRGL